MIGTMINRESAVLGKRKAKENVVPDMMIVASSFSVPNSIEIMRERSTANKRFKAADSSHAHLEEVKRPHCDELLKMVITAPLQFDQRPLTSLTKHRPPLDSLLPSLSSIHSIFSPLPQAISKVDECIKEDTIM